MMNLEDLKYAPSTRTICSIYPEKCSMVLDLGPTPQGGRTNYVIEGAPKGEFRLLHVQDSWESILDYAQIQHVGENRRTGRPESAENIARQLVREWTTGAGSGPGQQPGIMLIAGREPSKAELAHLTAVQNACFEWLVHTARGFKANHQWRNINEKHRIAGKWLGVKEDWVNDVGTDMDKGVCAHCYSPLLHPLATVCAVCHKDQPTSEARPVAAVKVHAAPPEKPFKTTAAPIAPPLQPVTA